MIIQNILSVISQLKSLCNYPLCQNFSKAFVISKAFLHIIYIIIYMLLSVLKSFNTAFISMNSILVHLFCPPSRCLCQFRLSNFWCFHTIVCCRFLSFVFQVLSEVFVPSLMYVSFAIISFLLFVWSILSISFVLPQSLMGILSFSVRFSLNHYSSECRPAFVANFFHDNF